MKISEKLNKIAASLKTAMSESEAWDTIEHMDAYFMDCAEIGQGINSKEIVKMSEAMRVLIKKRMGTALDIFDKVNSDTSKNICRRVVIKEYPGIEKLFGG